MKTKTESLTSKTKTERVQNTVSRRYIQCLEASSHCQFVCAYHSYKSNIP